MCRMPINFCSPQCFCGYIESDKKQKDNMKKEAKTRTKWNGQAIINRNTITSLKIKKNEMSDVLIDKNQSRKISNLHRK